MTVFFLTPRPVAKSKDMDADITNLFGLRNDALDFIEYFETPAFESIFVDEHYFDEGQKKKEKEKMEKMQRNRESARRSRESKKAFLKTLQEENHRLRLENYHLKNRIAFQEHMAGRPLPWMPTFPLPKYPST